MKIQNITNNYAFKGLIGSERRFVRSEKINGESYDYYERDYNPFSDETPDEIRWTRLRYLLAINDKDKMIDNSGINEVVDLVVGDRLNISKADYEDMMDNSQI